MSFSCGAMSMRWSHDGAIVKIDELELQRLAVACDMARQHRDCRGALLQQNEYRIAMCFRVNVCRLSQSGHCMSLQSSQLDLPESIMGKTLHNTIRLGRRSILGIVIDETRALLRRLRTR
jgi:hypothetical protein